MGVQGLWSLLQPAARPIKLDDLEGKRFAVDSSIWLYHFRMAMRDKEGRTLANAHILGFFWRICKLLHFGLRPVFVFDGGAPVMKRQTLIGRKTRRAGAKESHALAAKKLLNAQMRQAALAHVSTGSGNQGTTPSSAADGEEGGTGMDGNVVYFDDYDKAAAPQASSSRSPVKQSTLAPKEASPAKKKNIDYHRDPYALPNLDQDISTITASTSRAGDPSSDARGKGGPRRGRRNDFRFATDSELRHLLSSIAPSDIDMSSPLFRSLPVELQYELVGDMRAASRGTSYKRLQQMLKSSPNPIDFSKAQILNLKNRNDLTQRVLEVTDEIGDAHIKVPIRVSGERNREYVLVRREGDEGGFILGVRNQEGTSQDKAIVVGEEPERFELSSDEDDDSFEKRRRSASRRQHEAEDDDLDLDEVEIPTAASPSQRGSSSVSKSPSAFRASDANNPNVRRAVAEQLLSKRAEEHIRQKLRERGIVDDGEVLEEQLRIAREKIRSGGKGHELFGLSTAKGGRPSAAASGASAATALAYYDQDDDDQWQDDDDQWQDDDAQSISDDDDDAEQQLEQDKLADLARALRASERDSLGQQGVSRGPEEELASEDEIDLDFENVAQAADHEDSDVETVDFDPNAYADFYEDKGPTGAAADPPAADEEDLDLEQVQDLTRGYTMPIEEMPDDEVETNSILSRRESGPVLGFRRADRPGLRTGLDPKLFQKRQWYDEGSTNEKAGGIKVESPSPFKASTSPAKAIQPPTPVKVKASPAKPHFGDFVEGMPSPTKAAQVKRQRAASDAENKTRELELPTTPAPQREPSKRDELGRPEPEVAQLPTNDDTAATEILNEEAAAVAPTSSSPPPSEPSMPDAELVAIDQEAARAGEANAQPLIAEEGQVASPDSLPAPLEPEVSAEAAGDKEAQAAAGVEADEIMSPSPQPATQADVQDATASTAQEPILDNSQAIIDDHTVDRDMEDLVEPSMEASAAPSPTVADEEVEDDKEGSEGVSGPGQDSDSDEGSQIEWSPSPSPAPPTLGPDGFPLPTVEELEQMDADYEEEARALQGDASDIASFISRTKGQGLLEAQAEIAREVEALRAEHVNTRKSEEEITRQMAREIQMMLRLFGLPYITAPMEAEAQCAELVSQKLVDGIITDDSDVFLFGGTRIYKNMFNNNKVVECFLLSDIQRELGLDREKLVRLAFLLGSDYTEGLVSVGPVIAMEIMSLFPRKDGLVRFKEWWTKVQSGRDTPSDTKGKTMRRIKKTLQNKVHLDEHWPNPAVVEAYYEPSVDSSDEPFQWGLPDLDNLRTYLAEYLGWSITKTDQYVVPVIEAQSRRTRARGNQTTLDRNGFFDISGGTGVYAGRQLPKYGSSRLQNVVNGFRQANKAGSSKSKRARNTRDTAQAIESDGDEDEADGFEVVAGQPSHPASAAFDVLDVPEEAIGKAMASDRPVVRREHMRIGEREAREQLNATIEALEGAPPALPTEKATSPAKASTTVAPKRKATKAGDSTASSKRHREESTSPPASAARGRGRGRGRGKSTRGRGRGGGGGEAAAAPTPIRFAGGAPSTSIADPVASTSATEDTASPTTSTASPNTAQRGARKPARARGARGGPRHPHLQAARNMRLDGPIPESTSAPASAETVRGRDRRSESGEGGRSRSTSTSTSASVSRGSMSRTPSFRRQARVEIDLDGDGEGDGDSGGSS